MSSNKKRLFSKNILFYLTFSAVLLGVLGYTFWYNQALNKQVSDENAQSAGNVVVHKDDKNNLSNDDTGDVTYVSFGGSNVVIKDIIQIINRNNKDAKINQNPTNSNYERDSGIAINYKLPSVDYSVVIFDLKDFVSVSEGDLSEADWNGLITPIYNEITSYFDTNEFKKLVGQSEYNDYYQLDDSICVITTREHLINGLDASCGSVKDLESIANKVKPFRDSLIGDVSIDSSSDFFYDEPNISDSKIAGYQTATMTKGRESGFPGTSLYFYKKDGGSWTYFANHSIQGVRVFRCSAFESNPLTKSIFDQDKCVDESGKLVDF